MPKFDPRPLVPQNNVDILHTIWDNAGSDYQRRVTEPTKARIQQSVKDMWNYKPARNEFLDAFVNRIGLIAFQRLSWTNPYAKFKRGMLEYGDTIEEVYAGLIKAKAYDPHRDELERTLFGRHNIDVQSSFHRINRQDRYDFTINTDLLKRAFLPGDGLFSFISDLMTAPATSDQWDEFLAMSQLFREYYDNDGFFKVNIPNLADAASDGPDAKYALRRIREMAATLPFISEQYNAARMPVAARPDELELFITAEANAALDVEALAAAFNIDRTDVPMRINVIPSANLNIPGAQAVLTTRDFFVVADTNFETQSIANPAMLHQNYFLHHWQIVSASRFVPAVLFTTEPGTVIEITPTPVTSVPEVVVTNTEGETVTDVERGERYNITGSAVTTPEGGLNDAIRLTLVGATSAFTFITQTGTLSIGINEEAETLKIVATATDDSDFFSEVDVTVSGDLTSVWPPEATEDGDEGV